MLDDIRTWLKGIFQKNQDPSGACVMPGPRPESKRYAASGFIPVAEPTPCVSLAIQTPKSRSLRRSPGSPSLLQRYDPDRTDASRVTVPSPVTTTQPTSSVMRPTVLPPLTSRQHTATDFKSRRMATPACPPDWFPSGTISMISRTTHQTYSADPSPLFTGAAQNVGLSPVTTAVVTPSPAPKTSRVLQNNVPVVRNLVPPVMDPSLLEQAPPVAEKDTTNVKTITTSREKISGETFWIKVSGSGHSPQLPADSGVVSAVVLPSTSTPAKPQIIHGVQAKSPIILDVAIVDSPEGSVASSSESSINTVRRRAVAASAVFKSCESCDLDAAVSQVFDGTVPPSILTDEAPPNIAALEPDTLGLRTEGNGVDVHHIPWQQWSFPNASQTPDDIQYTPCPELPLLVSPPRFFNDQAQSIDTRPTQMVEHADPGPVIDHDNNDGGSASHSSRPLMEPTSFMPNGKYDSGQERQLGNALGLSSPPVSQMDLLQPPNVVPHMTSSDVPPHVNYIMTSSVHQGPCSVVGPNAFPFAADQLPPTAFVPDFSLCPRYAAHSLLEYLPFRCPELLPSIPTYISADKKHWVTSDYIDILPVELPLWHEGGHIQHNSQHSIQDDRPRIYTTLGIVSQSPGIINYLVYNGKSHRIPHMLTLWSPAGMDSVELRLNTNHLKFLRYLAGKPNHPNLAVYYNDEPTIWCCRDEFIWYLSPRDCGNLAFWSGAVEASQMPLIIRDLTSGLDFLHKSGVIHWDLRAHNIIIDHAGYCKIGNFGKADFMPYDSESKYTLEGRRILDSFSLHTAPELLRNGVPLEIYHFNHAVDMWALGIIVFELQVGKINTEQPLTLLDLVQAMISSNAPPELIHLTFKGFLVEDPRFRAIAGAVVACPYLSEAWQSRAPPFLNLDIPPLLPVTPLPASELNQPGPYMARRQALEQLEQDLQFKLPCDESFRVGRDC